MTHGGRVAGGLLLKWQTQSGKGVTALDFKKVLLVLSAW